MAIQAYSRAGDIPYENPEHLLLSLVCICAQTRLGFVYIIETIEKQIRYTFLDFISPQLIIFIRLQSLRTYATLYTIDSTFLLEIKTGINSKYTNLTIKKFGNVISFEQFWLLQNLIIVLCEKHIEGPKAIIHIMHYLRYLYQITQLLIPFSTCIKVIRKNPQ